MPQAADKHIKPESEPENPRHRVTIAQRPPSNTNDDAATSSHPRITFAAIKRIFRDNVGSRQIPADKVLQDMVSQLNSEWVRDYKQGLWEVRMAIRIILDNGPAVIQAHERLYSKRAQAITALYAKLLQAAQKIAATNVQIPQVGDKSPTNTHAKKVANIYHRDWWFVFNAVSIALTDAGWAQIGKGHESPAVKISCEILKKIGIKATPESLAKMLARRQAPSPPKWDKHT